MSDAAQAVATQNAARQDANNNHGSNCAPLTWDTNLANAAQQWAEAMAQSQNFDHSDANSRPGQGENLFLYAGTNAVAEFNAAAVAWCNEIANYHGEPVGEGDFENYGHYTQVVWPTSTSVGMGVAQGSNGAFYVCGRYSPAGNVVGVPAWGANGGPNPGPTAKGHADGVYLMNVVNGNQQKSGFAWYANMGNNDGTFPQAWLDLTETGFYQWEGNPFSATFRDGNVFKGRVDANANQTDGTTVCGSASNNFHSFKVYRDDYRILYTTADGWQAHPVYRCV